MKNEQKQKQNQNNANTIPAWECPKCGTTHPITVPSCCINSKKDDSISTPPYTPRPADPSPYLIEQPVDTCKPVPYCLNIQKKNQWPHCFDL